jgi:hypothetical protein
MGRLAVPLALLVAGCGYRLGAPSASLPAGVRQVAIPVLQNRTAEPQVEALLTEALREYAARSGLLGGAGAEASLEGAVVSVSAAPIVAGSGRLPTYRLGVTLQLTLLRNGQSLAQATVTQTEDFPSGADVLLTESNRGAALRRLAEALARDAFERLAGTS